MVCSHLLTTIHLLIESLNNIEIYKELKEKNRKFRNQANERLKRARENGESRPRKNKRGAFVQTGSSSKMNHLQNLAKSSEPYHQEEDEEEEE
jgi:hypothetical protein